MAAFGAKAKAEEAATTDDKSRDGVDEDKEPTGEIKSLVLLHLVTVRGR